MVHASFTCLFLVGRSNRVEIEALNCKILGRDQKENIHVEERKTLGGPGLGRPWLDGPYGGGSDDGGGPGGGQKFAFFPL